MGTACLVEIVDECYVLLWEILSKLNWVLVI